MAIFHWTVKVISRGTCQYATAAAAYIAGDRIKSEYDGRVNDYSRRKGVVYSEIMLPDNAPRAYMDRSVLWNSVEQIEKGRRAQQARSIEAALPRELSHREQTELIREYLQSFVDAGMCVDWSLHDKGDGNPHFHAMLTMRPLNPDGTWGEKSRKVYELDEDGNKVYDKRKKQYKCHTEKTTDWDNRNNVVKWRKQWADTVNRKLSSLSINQRIDHRSYADQGLHKIPQIHEGKNVYSLRRKTGDIKIAGLNRRIRTTNALLRSIRQLMMTIYSVMEDHRNREYGR